MVGSGADAGVRKMSLLPAFNEPMLWTFPCGEDKKPRTANGFLDAVQGVWWPRAELVGVPTGERNGFDVLDIDGEAGRKWYDLNYDAIPQTRAHSTQRGMHLLFRNAPGLRCSTGSETHGIAPCVDVRAGLLHLVASRRIADRGSSVGGMARVALRRGNGEAAP